MPRAATHARPFATTPRRKCRPARPGMHTEAPVFLECPHSSSRGQGGEDRLIGGIGGGHELRESAADYLESPDSGVQDDAILELVCGVVLTRTTFSPSQARFETVASPADGTIDSVSHRGALSRTSALRMDFTVLPHDDESHFFDHAVIGLGKLSLGREVVADEHGVRGVQTEALHRAEMQFAAAGDPDFGRRGS